jgi:hypothetical protein
MATPENTQPKFCINCGKPLQAEWNVCPNCGLPLKQPTFSSIPYQPQYNMPPPYTMPPQPNGYDSKKEVAKGIAGLSIIVSVIGLFFAGFLFGAVGIVLGAIAVTKNEKAFGIAGIILGIIIVVLSVTSFLIP